MAPLRLGIRSRLLLIGLIAAIPALLLVFQMGRDEYRAAAEQLEARAVDTVRQLAAAQQRGLVQARTPLALLAGLPQITAGDTAACNRVLGVVREQSRLYANLGVLGPDGRLLCSAEPFSGRPDYSDFEFFQLARERGAFSVGSLREDPILGREGVGIALPAVTAEGAEVVMFATLETGFLEEALGHVELPPDAELTLVDRNNRLIAERPPGERTAGTAAPEAARLRSRTNGDHGAVTVDVGEERVVYAFAAPQGNLQHGLMIYARLPATDLQQAAAELQRRTLLALLGTLALVLGGTVLAGQWFVVRPVKNLVQAARRLGRGRLDTRSRLHDDGSELGELAQNFDQMAANLEQRSELLEAQGEQIRRLNRIYAVLSGINSLIIRAGRRDEMLQEACNLAVSAGGLPLAWIATLSIDGRAIERVWCAGVSGSARQELLPAIDAEPAADGLLRPALREGRSVIYRNPAEDPRWPAAARRELAARGFGACLLLPLRMEGQVIGCFGLYAHEPTRFQGEELRLLENMCADISLSLVHIEQADRLAFLSRQDPLTGLPNRAVFLDRVGQALTAPADPGEEQHHPALLAIGIDGMHGINSVYGQRAGDQALQHAARRIEAALPPGASLARLGNSQFAALLPRAPSAEHAASYADQLLTAFRRPLESEGDGDPLYLGLRIGISIAPHDGTEAADLLQHAETARDSLRGRSGHYRFYTAELQHRASRRLSVEHALRRALEHDEFHLLYQPVVDIRSRRLTGVEALLRWQHPRLGNIGPAHFIPIAEAAGLIAPIGEWALATACQQARTWGDAGVTDFKVAVNVSVNQLRQPAFLPKLNEILSKCGTDSPELSLEITESELMADADEAVQLLGELRARGLALSIDDFGTGYSSLAYLKRFPVDTLKIDMAFIRELHRDPANVSIVQAIIALAQHLQLATIAEGVEYPEQLTLLAELGCQAAQGYLFSRPIPAAQVPELVRSGFAQS